MESFSWSDSLRALAAPCLSCLRTSKAERERNDLEDLLVDSGSGTTDAETLSLHSNPGSPRRKRTRFTRSIRLFGWNLFGRPPIRLPDDDDDDDDPGATGREEGGGSRRSRRRPPPAAISTTTLDSDAAPLDTAAIESHATRRAEEEAARAERRARRRERKERKRAAELARTLEHAAILDGDAEFEGFPGSGERRAAPAPDNYRYADDDEDDGDEEGDFGAGAYARRSRGGSDSGRGSDSRSRTSTSVSSGPQQHQGQPYNHHYISQQPSAAPPLAPAPHRKKGKSSRSSASKTSSSSRRTHSSPSASQSPSLASPVATQFLDAEPTAPPPRAAAAQQFEGFPNDLGLQTAGIERLSSGFPSPGFGGPRNGKRDMGAFLANRGDA
ncbi:hypothetical protein EI94DRAFT_1727364 [Lactarius quietus]|nr:hypothetical protein EI94DRAFT_1727364 [Lactarius quietus]